MERNSSMMYIFTKCLESAGVTLSNCVSIELPSCLNVVNMEIIECSNDLQTFCSFSK